MRGCEVIETMMTVKTHLHFFVLMAATFVASAAIADEPAAEPSSESSPTPAAVAESPVRGRRAAVAEAEDAALTFAREHHPELANLLERLQRANPRAYRAAIIDLSKDRVRLERMQERAPERYEYELQLWTMDSQIRLLAARAGRGNADELRPRLKELMEQRQELRLSHLRQERERLTTRLERVDGQIAEIEGHPTADADVDALLARVKKRVQSGQGRPEASASVRPPETPAADTADDAHTETQSPQD